MSFATMMTVFIPIRGTKAKQKAMVSPVQFFKAKEEERETYSA